MSLGKQISDLGERIASLETTAKFLDQNLHYVRRLLYKSDFNPLWLRIMIAINAGIFAWLSTLTVLILKKL